MMNTALYAAILALIYIGLTVLVVHGRWKYQVGLGDGRNPDLTQRVRMHGNFAEYVPLALILLFFVESGPYPPLVVHVLGIALVLARLLHAWGIHRSPFVSFGRGAGTVLTILVLLTSALLLLWQYFAVAATPLT